MNVLLSDICSIFKGKQINGSELLENGKYCYLNGGINPSGYWNEYNVNENTISISEGGNSCGYVNYNNEKFWCGAHCYYLSDLKVNTKYLYYNLKYNEKKIMNLRTGACMPNIKKSDISKFEICIENDSKKQKEIVNKLETLSNLILEKNSQIENLEKLKLSEYSKLFENEEEFDELGNLCSIKARIGWQGLTKKEYLDEGDYYLVTGVDFADGLIDFKNCHYVTKDRFDQDTNIQLKDGDVLVTKDGTIGKVAMVKNLDKPATLNSGVFVVRPLTNKVNNIYLEYSLKSYRFSNFIEKIKTGATISHLNQGAFLKYKIPVPSIEKQNKFVEIISNINDLINEYSSDLINLNNLFNSVASKYFEQ